MPFFLLLLKKFSTVCPHPGQKNGEFARGWDNHVSVTFRTHQRHTP
jgi:hypothetical protein